MKQKILMGFSALAFCLVLMLNFAFVNDNQASGLSLKTVESVAMATGESGGGNFSGCYTNPYDYTCTGFEGGIVIGGYGINAKYSPGSGYNCNFTGVYGPPYYCQDKSCTNVFTQRHCVQGQ